MPIHHHVLGRLPASTERSFAPIAASAQASCAFDNVVVAGAPATEWIEPAGSVA